MTKEHRHPAFPRNLISFINLQGNYGTLDVVARDRHSVELTLSDGNFVALRKEQWAALRAAVDPLFGAVETVIVATDTTGEPLVVEEREEVVVTRKRRPAARSRRSAE